ncbi:flagellar brake protein [Burkholderia sp. Ax-1719]|uniref:flagellar brake protein n=1 Tax=Burkholderia sp. Ax-1719 TaxID=2608334 RepID=UPI00141DF2B8|nr:flagellar brake protein [Burkholderia sp. Ax-1719]NIE64530.1 flagellar brake protein [Burkholderia sp. Ax-1719]
MTDSTEATEATTPQTAATEDAPTILTPADIALGQPLDWPLIDADGTPLLDAGATLVGEMERAFLFRHFAPQRGDREPPASAPVKPQEQDTALAVRDLHLTIGALMGLRPQQGASGAPMHPCKLIGVAPNEAIFVTLPYVDRRPIEITPGENVEIVAIASHAVYRFVCTIHAMYQAPLGYLLLSKPANIRMLRERKSIRVRAQFPVRYGIGEESEGYQGVALARGVSALGLSIAAPWALAKVGERLRVAWRLRSGELDSTIETSAVVRNVHQEDGPEPLVTLGLELDHLSPADQMAMKVYVFDRQDDVLYWTGAAR